MLETETIDGLMERSTLHLKAGEHEIAARLCRLVLVQEPSLVSPLFQMAVAQSSADAPGVALGSFQRVLCIVPGASAIHHNIGVCARRLDDHVIAESALRRAQTLDPTGLGALDALAQTFSTMGRHGDALSATRYLRVLLPNTAGTHATVGFVAWRSGRLEMAETALRRAMILEPADYGPAMNMANVHVARGDLGSAVVLYRRLARLKPCMLTVWGNLGLVLLEMGDPKAAADAYCHFARLAHGRPLDQEGNDPFPHLPVNPITTFNRRTAWHRLAFEREQLRFLRAVDELPAEYEREVAAYDRILGKLSDAERTAISLELSEPDHASISRMHDRLLYRASTGWSNVMALNPELDWSGLQSDYLADDPRIIVVDDFLRPDALVALRRFCLRSTMWFELKGAGYLGAYFREGFNDPLLIRVAEDLVHFLPGILAGHPLRMMWAYTYEQSMQGINPHADFARVNVNFWITPDEANLDPETGGLLIYRRPAPKDWTFDEYNAAPRARIMEHLGEEATRPIRIPHRQNRAVIFDSRLFHETDNLSFRQGFENRRLNVTMLFGRQ
ncbi:MAG: hypothetical protein CMM47_07725 [Rhodospirillaceae bacterium]|nr:hypothetical protein [Rhodospirillaceae bacterium]